MACARLASGRPEPSAHALRQDVGPAWAFVGDVNGDLDEVEGQHIAIDLDSRLSLWNIGPACAVEAEDRIAAGVADRELDRGDEGDHLVGVVIIPLDVLGEAELDELSGHRVEGRAVDRVDDKAGHEARAFQGEPLA